MADKNFGRIVVRSSAGFSSPAPDPDADRAALRKIQEAARAGDLDRAIALADQALRGGVEHPMVLNLIALKLEQQERFEDALAVLQRAHALAPDDLGSRQALALCLHRLERYAEALAHFDAAVAAHPDFAPGHCARGAALEALGRLLDAEAAYHRALDLQPQNLVALAGLASLFSRRGLHGDARALANRVAEAQPNYPDAVMVLASAEQAEGDAAGAAARLDRLIADPRLTAVQRALANGLLGDVLDSQDRVADAFDAYRACNEELRRAYAGQYGAGQGALDYARQLLAHFDGVPSAGWTRRDAAPASPAAGHVFLLGFPRSGTTLLEQVLASHPMVEALEERDTLVDAVRAFMGRPGDLERLAHAGEAELGRFRGAYWARVREEGAKVEGKVFVDKHPLNTFKLPLIAKLFPEAKVLFARRDPRDVVLSCYRRRFRMSPPMYQLLTLETAAAYYDAAMHLAARLEGVLPIATHIVRHETLVEDFDREVKAVCDFLDLEWTEAMRDFAARTRDRGVATPSAVQLAGGLSAEGVGAWRRYREQLKSVLPALRPWVERYGYPAD